MMLLRHMQVNIFKLENLVKNYKSLYKNAQGDTDFLDEFGVYYLVFSSEMDNTIKIKKWIIEIVVPKYGQSKLDREMKSKMENVRQQPIQQKPVQQRPHGIAEDFIQVTEYLMKRFFSNLFGKSSEYDKMK